MSDYEILIDDNLYEVHCIECDEIVAILEKNHKTVAAQNYLCDHCAITVNENKFAQQEIERLARLQQ